MGGLKQPRRLASRKSRKALGLLVGDEIRRDVGCSDLQAAAQSRQRQKEGYATDWWRWYEAVVKYTPRGQPLGKDIPQGELPQAGKRVNRPRKEDED